MSCRKRTQMVLTDEKITDNKKLRKLEDQKLGGLRIANPLTFPPSSFFISKYLCLSVVSLIPGRLSVRVRNPSDWRRRSEGFRTPAERRVNLFPLYYFLFPALEISQSY
jgi:hypothetical protein